MFKDFFIRLKSNNLNEFPRWPEFEKDEVNSVQKVLKSGKVNYWTGTKGKIFEKDFANLCNSKYAIAISNGTLALDAAYRAMETSVGDEFITTPRTFVATSSTAALQGIIPKFADVDQDSGNITVETIEPLINKKTKFISIVHLAGWPADMVRICDLAKSYNLKVIEDCSQAHGAKINGKSVGSFGDISTWSFCNDKIISIGGEGGMITTNDENYYEFLWSFKDHGKSKKLVDLKDQPPGYRWLHSECGLNYRLTEMQSAIGIKQIRKLEQWNKIRKRNALILFKKLSKLKLIRIKLPRDNINHAWYKFHCYLKPEYLKSDWTRNRIIKEINNLGFPAFHGSCSEIYLEKCFQELKHDAKKTPIARKLGQTSLMFLVHPTISEKLMCLYSKIICKVLKESTI